MQSTSMFLLIRKLLGLLYAVYMLLTFRNKIRNYRNGFSICGYCDKGILVINWLIRSSMVIVMGKGGKSIREGVLSSYQPAGKKTIYHGKRESPYNIHVLYYPLLKVVSPNRFYPTFMFSEVYILNYIILMETKIILKANRLNTIFRQGSKWSIWECKYHTILFKLI